LGSAPIAHCDNSMTPVRHPDPLQGHLIMSAAAFYGHTKPMVELAIKIEKLKPTVITLLVADTLFDVIDRELKKSLDLNVQKDRHQYIQLAGLECNKSSFDSEVINEAFAQTYKMLATGTKIRRRPMSEELITDLPIPSAVIVDVSCN